MLTENLIKECGSKMKALAEEIASTKTIDQKIVILKPNDFLKSCPDRILKELAGWAKDPRGSKFIYMFSVQSKGPAKELRKLFEDAKKKERDDKGRRAFARAVGESKTLYVGSSSSIVSRIGQHLGHKNETVYSIQLRHWLVPNAITSLDITIWKFPLGTSQQVLQAIEDYLWIRAKPMLGKQGGR